MSFALLGVFAASREIFDDVPDAMPVCYRFAASTLVSTWKKLANVPIIVRLNGFLPASTYEIVDLGIPVWRCSSTWLMPLASSK